MNGTVCKAPLIMPELHPPLGKVLLKLGPSRSTYRAPEAMRFGIELVHKYLTQPISPHHKTEFPTLTWGIPFCRFVARGF